MKLYIQVNSGRLPAQLAGVADAVQNTWWQKFVPAAEIAVGREHDRYFKRGAGPDGQTWKPLSPLTLALSAGVASMAVGGATKARRGKSGVWRMVGPGGADGQQSAVIRRQFGSRPMMSTGRLLAALTNSGVGAVRRRASASLTIGVNLPGAARLHYGGTFPVTGKQRGYLSHVLGRWFAAETITTPARPFIGLDSQARGVLAQVSRAKLAQAIREAAR